MLSALFEIPFNQNPEIIVFSEFSNQRLIYTLDFIIKRVWQKNYLLTNNKETFIHSDKLKINYSEHIFENNVNVYPLMLLKEKGIDKNFRPEFQISSSAHYSEDIFSKVFYFISRYEEWQGNFTKDKHGRFEINASVFKEKLHHPIADKSIEQFKQFIQIQYPAFQPTIFYKEILTFDLDNILAFKGKNILRTAAAMTKHILGFENTLLQERIKVLFNQSPDPFEEVYDFIEKLQSDYPIIFFILCRSNTTFDRAADIQNSYTKKILNRLKNFAHIGLHPSYYSFDNSKKIETEKNILEEILQQKIIASRQHYLRTDIKITPKLLLKAGITYDFTMGFASDIGFRAGTSYPFYYYDFENEKTEQLLFVPFSVMDGAYFNYQNIPVNEAIQNINSIRQCIQKIGGYFIPLFHEITLCPLFNPSAYEWRRFFEK